ncbi:MAG: permease [bacterium]|nr:permease [bacterium]
MNLFNRTWKSLTAMVAVFGLFYYFPLDQLSFSGPLFEALRLAKWYAREHVILCLVPAFFIAGAIAVFIRQGIVLKYLGAESNKFISYGVASTSGSILAVCSCTIIPLFAGIYRMGAGLGPASAFLYAGPAINIMAIILTARVLGVEIGVARAVGAVLFSIVIGLIMALLFRSEEQKRNAAKMATPDEEVKVSATKNGLLLGSMVGILVFANLGSPQESTGLWYQLYSAKWYLTSLLGFLLALMLWLWFSIPRWHLALATAAVIGASLIFDSQPIIPFVVAFVGLAIVTGVRKDDAGEWFSQSFGFAKQILPLLLAGIIVAGLLLGSVEQRGLIPPHWITNAVGGNGLGANLFAAVVGAFMYFATLTEIPILLGLLGNGMGQGPALALLLAGPALSLPNMLVIRSVMGTKKTIVFILLVIVMATISGLLFGAIYQ